MNELYQQQELKIDEKTITEAISEEVEKLLNENQQLKSENAALLKENDILREEVQNLKYKLRERKRTKRSRSAKKEQSDILQPTLDLGLFPELNEMSSNSLSDESTNKVDSKDYQCYDLNVGSQSLLEAAENSCIYNREEIVESNTSNNENFVSKECENETISTKHNFCSDPINAAISTIPDNIYELTDEMLKQALENAAGQ